MSDPQTSGHYPFRRPTEGKRMAILTLGTQGMPKVLGAMAPDNVAGRWLADKLHIWGIMVEEPDVAGPTAMDALRLAARPTAAEAMARFLNVAVQPEQSPFREAWEAISPRLWPLTALRYMESGDV